MNPPSHEARYRLARADSPSLANRHSRATCIAYRGCKWPLTTRIAARCASCASIKTYPSNRSKDGHDQMPLRKVLYRHRNDVYDLPARVQRRGLSHSPCDGEPLLWHAHRADRVKWARAHKHGAAEVCGFVV